MQVTREDLQRLCPRPSGGAAAKNWDGYVEAICAAGVLLHQFGITTALRWVHLVATWAHETGGFTILWESGAYSANRIVQVFGPGRHSAAVGPAEAARLAGNAYALFERVYGLGNPRMAHMLGNTQIGDGYNFRGLGIEQITGREAHVRYATKIGCSLEELALPMNSVKAALLEWAEKGCNPKADRDDVLAVRKAINGGTNGLDEVRLYVAKAKRIWGQQQIASPLVLEAADGEQGPGPDQGEASKAAWEAGVLGAVAGAAPALLELGSEGPSVQVLQQKLTDAGYPTGMVDGKFGALTERMVAGFQVAHMMTGTGKVDQATWDAIVASATVDAVPGRAHIDGAALTQRGDPVFAALKRRLWGWVAAILSFFGISVDQAANLGGVDTALDKAQDIHRVASRSWGLVGSLVSLRTIVTVLVLALAVWGIVSASRAIAAYIQSVRKGAVLGGQQP